MKTIGLVLPSAPGYSETFFSAKIAGLTANNFNVILFAKGEMNKELKATQVRPYPVVSQRWRMFFYLPVVLGITFLRTPARVLKFWRTEKQCGHGTREIAERLYISAHILPRSLDWLHFGFITQAVRRESLAAVMDAKMGVSLRGYDISIYPLMHPGSLAPIWPRITKLHVISDDLLRAAEKFGKPATLPVEKITPAINVSDFESTLAGARELGTPLKLLTVARLHWKKGLEYSLEACAILKRQGIAFTYTIVGDGAEKEKLVFLADQLGISEQIVFAGKLSSAKVISHLHSSDIYLQPSIQEGFCNAVLEAQAAGMICIVSDAEGLPENVEHGITGWVLPKRDASSIANQIVSVSKISAGTLEKMRKDAATRIALKFDSRAQSEKWNRFYTQ